MSTWLDEQIERNLSWRAEAVLDEIHGVVYEEEEVPDSSLSFAEIAAAVMNGRWPREFEPKWEIK